jgi:hypothetical protein
MAATIVSGVCEDHAAYELMEPSTTENPKKGKTVFLRLRKLISTHLKQFQSLFHTHTQ